MTMISYYEVLNRASVEAPERANVYLFADRLRFENIHYDGDEDKFPRLMVRPIDIWQNDKLSGSIYLAYLDDQPVCVMVSRGQNYIDELHWVSKSAVNAVRQYLETLTGNDANEFLNFITPETTFEIRS